MSQSAKNAIREVCGEGCGYPSCPPYCAPFAASSVSCAVDIALMGLRELLRDVADNGLVHWKPKTPSGATNRSLMLARIERALSESL